MLQSSTKKKKKWISVSSSKPHSFNHMNFSSRNGLKKCLIAHQMSSCVVWPGEGDGCGAGKWWSSCGYKAIRGLDGKLLNEKDILVFAALFL